MRSVISQEQDNLSFIVTDIVDRCGLLFYVIYIGVDTCELCVRSNFIQQKYSFETGSNFYSVEPIDLFTKNCHIELEYTASSILYDLFNRDTKKHSMRVVDQLIDQNCILLISLIWSLNCAYISMTFFLRT